MEPEGNEYIEELTNTCIHSCMCILSKSRMDKRVLTGTGAAHDPHASGWAVRQLAVEIYPRCIHKPTAFIQKRRSIIAVDGCTDKLVFVVVLA